MSCVMRPIIPIFFLISASFFFRPLPVAAADVSGGFAMHGHVKMPEGFRHFDYANPEAPKGGYLHQSAVGSFDTLNPFSLKGKAAQGLNLTYDRLTARSWDEPFTLYPLIAEHIDVAPDRSSIRFTLNPKARFQDGSPITVDDVLFTFETLKANGRPNMQQIYKLVSSAQKTGEREVTFTFGPGYDRESAMIIAMMPVLSKAWWAGRDFDQTSFDRPVTSGPYKITKVDPGRKVVYTRDPNYWAKDLPVNKGLYNFDTVSFDYFRDDTVALEAFKAGDVDVRIENNPAKWARAYDVRDTKTDLLRKDALEHGRVERMWGFVFNTRRAPFDSLAVRKAFSLAVDYDWVNRNIFHGLYRPLDSFYPNSVLAATGLPSAKERALLNPFQSSLPPDVFGPAWRPPTGDAPSALRDHLREADRLLKQAGWIVRSEKRVDAKTGAPLRFEILLGDPQDEKVALAFKRSLARLGVDVTLRTLDSAAFHDRLIGYDFDTTLYFWQNTLSPGTEQMLYWGCASAQQKGRFNYAGICTPATEALAKAVPQVQTYDDLITHTRALDRVLTHEHYAIPLFYSGRDFVASWPGFSHPKTTALYGNVMESWWFSAPSAKQH